MKLIKVKCKDADVQKLKNKRDGKLVKKEKDKEGCFWEVYKNSAGNYWWRFVIPDNFEPLKYYPKDQRKGAWDESKSFYKTYGNAEVDAEVRLLNYKHVIRERGEFFKKNYPEYQKQK